MIDIRIIDGEFEIGGDFDLGYMGVYDDDMITIENTPGEVREWGIVADNNKEDSSDEELAKFLTKYFNDFEKKVKKNRKQVNNNFLRNIYLDMNNAGTEFWNIEKIFDPNAVPKGEKMDDTLYDIHEEELGKAANEYEGSPNDGSVEKADFEALLKEYFPMFRWDALIEEVVPETLHLCDGSIAFQCSDDYNNAFLCGAYDELDEDLIFSDWHNF
ncbi:MAG: hypothetical protein IKP27_06520 [Paludibacteraceae bacterium]|nr:hypothetical protein [Paludibacteraceae bacterium]